MTTLTVPVNQKTVAGRLTDDLIAVVARVEGLDDDGVTVVVRIQDPPLSLTEEQQLRAVITQHDPLAIQLARAKRKSDQRSARSSPVPPNLADRVTRLETILGVN